MITIQIGFLMEMMMIILTGFLTKMTGCKMTKNTLNLCINHR